MSNCDIFHNSDLGVEDLMTSLVVCDGDATFAGNVYASGSLAIANGSIRSEAGLGSQCCYFARGDIAAKRCEQAPPSGPAGKRYSVPLEAGLFHIRRGTEDITRVAYFRNGLEK